MQSNTGQNDASSVWGSGLLSTVEKAAGVAANVASALKGSKKTASAQTATATPGWQTYLPWILGGLAGVAVLVFLFKK